MYKMKSAIMKLGLLSLSLKVADVEVSKAFYVEIRI